MPSPPAVLTGAWCAECGRFVEIGTRANAAKAALSHTHPVGFERYHREARHDAMPEVQHRRGAIEPKRDELMAIARASIEADVNTGKRCARCRYVFSVQRPKQNTDLPGRAICRPCANKAAR